MTTSAAAATFDPRAEEVALRAIAVMARDPADPEFDRVVHPACVNHEAKDEPPAARGTGPAAVRATAAWLQAAYAELRWDVHEVVAERDIVAIHCTMSGRHVGDFVTYDAAGQVAEVFPPTGATFATTQTHWFRVADGQMVEHWANRDDLGTAKQLGWVPPTPRYLARMALGRRRARRAAGKAT
ncbi:ester cyclase [Conexibacter sp. SYSU D00693]|uniref:ester cyclase n=1 Tax=Conexibacter sp. SYSU D00693 TaxID=2812560 RepID=UPI00196AFE6E|nr:ester cyclase [Conexibacter sp. SYSU D00693]